ncbi:hypothetical protein C725_0045 [Pacificimonas flava]|uniref:Uncharacterized protein n=1 Tax=Pacificimonas flava TaxID=1234595 RepID=M2SFH4_9SPHN|nr:hypothetical protein C725_0045 [Pacificimonas flava]
MWGCRAARDFASPALVSPDIGFGERPAAADFIGAKKPVGQARC